MAKRVTKAEWLAAGLQALEQGGVEAVRIDQLAKRLRISRSGFYWHFKDRKDLLGDILQYWKTEFTDVVVRRIGALEGTPEERLVKLMQMIEQYELNRYELPIRAWAHHDPLARDAVATVNKVRMDYVRSLFSEMGFGGDELEMRTMVFVCYHTWEKSMFSDMPAAKLAKMRKLRAELLSRK